MLKQNCPKCGERGRYTGKIFPRITVGCITTKGGEHNCPNGHTFPVLDLMLAA